MEKNLRFLELFGFWSFRFLEIFGFWSFSVFGAFLFSEFRIRDCVPVTVYSVVMKSFHFNTTRTIFTLIKVDTCQFITLNYSGKFHCK
jgi:hypothetical protein